MIRNTLENTPLYHQPTTDLSNPKIYLLPNRSVNILKELKVVNPFGGNREDVLIFGQVAVGWVLMEKNYHRYVDQGPLCPICYEETETDSSPRTLELPCCNKKMHGECFYNQLMSYSSEGGIYRETHITCPFCRKNYFDISDTYYYWTNSRFTNAYSCAPEFDWRKWRLHLRTILNLHKQAKECVREKDAELEEGEERGGWAVFVCKSCKKPAIPGKLSCAEELNLDLEKKDFVCDPCKWSATNTKDHRCFIHGKKFAMFKCDSCCSMATWDCFSNHYCDRCHRDASAYKNYPCPGGDKCPLGIAHPPNSHGMHGGISNTGFVLGCFKCFDPSYEVNSSYDSNAPDPFRQRDIQNDDMIQMFAYAAPPPAEEIEKLKKEYEAKQIEIEPEESEDESEEEGKKVEVEVQIEPYIVPEVVDDIDLQGYHMFAPGSSDEEEESSSEDEIVPADAVELEEIDLQGYHMFAHEGEGEEEEEEEESSSVGVFSWLMDSEESDESDSSIDMDFGESDLDIESETESEEVEKKIIEKKNEKMEVLQDEILIEIEEPVLELGLDLFAPPMMVNRSSCCSVDSVLSEDSLNLLRFNRGFGSMDEGLMV